jgi:hypothetical protein
MSSFPTDWYLQELVDHTVACNTGITLATASVFTSSSSSNGVKLVHYNHTIQRRVRIRVSEQAKESLMSA